MVDLPQAVFLDRDGVINKEVNGVRNRDQFALIEGTAEAISRLNKHNIKAIVVTNQGMIAKGFYTEQDLADIHKHMHELLAQEQAHVDDVFYCPHHPEKGWEGEVPELKIECTCRKPKPGMLLQAAEKHRLILKNCVLVGDSTRDIRAAQHVGCKTIMVRTGHGGEDGLHEVEPDHTCTNLKEAVDTILGGIQ